MAVSETLRSVIDAGRSSKRLDELSSARVIAKIAQQAHAAQQKAGAGKAIGPITPTSVSFQPSGEVKLEAGAAGSSLGYTAPEQLDGGSGDRRSDVFSLGAVLWEALTHTRLFDAMNDAAVRAAVKDREITAPADVNANVPAELSAICMRALSRNPADRYQSLKSFAVEIEEFLEEAGYTDDDSKIAQFLVAMNLPTPVTTQPMPTFVPAKNASSGASVAAALAAANTEPTPAASTATPPAAATLPTMAKSPTQPPPTTSPAGTKPPPMGATGVAASEPAPKSPTAPPANATTTVADKPTNGAKPATQPPPMSPTAFARPSSTTPPTNAATTPAAPSILTDTPAEPPAKPSETAPPASTTPASTTPASTTPVSTTPASTTPASTTLPPASQIGKSTVLGMAPAPAPADWSDKPAPAMTPMPPVLPETVVDAKHADPKQTLVGPFETKAPAAEPAAATPPLEAAPAVAKAVPPMDDQRATIVDAKIPETVAAAAAATAVEAAAAKPAATATAAESTPKPARAASQSEGAPNKPTSDKGSTPNPVDVVSLPGRESKGDLLAGWGWGTGKHDAIPPSNYGADDDEEFEKPNTRKPLMYAIGGGLAVALLVTIVAFAAGGSKSKKKPNNAPSTQQEALATGSADPTQAQGETPTPVETQPAAGSGSDVGSATGSDTGSAVGSAVDPAAAEKAAAEQAAAEKAAAEQAAADKAAADKAAAEQAVADKAAAEKAAKDQAAADKAAAAKADADKKELARQEKLAKQEAEKAAKADAAAKAEAEKKERREAARAEAEKKRLAREEAKKNGGDTAKKDPTKEPRKADKTVAKADPPKTDTKVDVETAYRIGLQQFARGDTAGALASLRTSLAGNPNYAPTWRGLGLVFEKMGQKDQAKNAYKRYLQLAPTAGDAEIIRGRLERLGS